MSEVAIKLFSTTTMIVINKLLPSNNEITFTE